MAEPDKLEALLFWFFLSGVGLFIIAVACGLIYAIAAIMQAPTNPWLP